MRIIQPGNSESEEGIVEFKIGSPDRGLVSINRLVLDRGTCFSLPRQSVNGFLCITSGKAFLIYNPITGEKSPWIEINNKQARNQIAFGFDKQSNEHKVICISSSNSDSGSADSNNQKVNEVFTVGKNTWRIIDAVPPIALGVGYNEKVPYYVDGCIYRRIRPDIFHPWEREQILRFDIATEKFRIIPIPDFVIDPDRYKFSQTVELTEIDGCIAVLNWVNEVCISLWKFREVADGNIEWIEEIIDIPSHWNGKPDLSIQALTGTRQIFLHYQYSDSIFYYNRDTRESIRFPICSECDRERTIQV
ncbi:putative F-box protein At4g38870 [Papaver somniferum]|uniref:putative F-box protein At4g38870 n=1 Tax=Papaver somniferum TaxID=3469 RepID=UPI000E6F8D62|nr:putative F-box protein At4g38870 [Papaver somniferum]